jgi:hypothetical protein
MRRNQTLVPPKLFANVFHTDTRLYTMLLIDPGASTALANEMNVADDLFKMYQTKKRRRSKLSSTG